MAVMRPTPKDIGNYEAKLLGPFTQRQVVCLGAGIVPSVAVAFLIKGAGGDVYITLAAVILIMAIPCFLAFGQKITYGMKPEDFAIGYYQYNILSSKVRLYKTSTLDDRLEEAKKEEQEKLALRSKKARERAMKKRKKEEEMRKKAAGMRFLSPKYRPYPHKASKNHKSYR